MAALHVHRLRLAGLPVGAAQVITITRRVNNGEVRQVRRSLRSEAVQRPWGRRSLPVAQAGTILRRMKVEEIAEAVAKLPPDQLARFRRWFTAFEAGRPEHAQEIDTAATKLGRLAGRAFAELKRRTKEP
ncbi:MAG TPA: hypothetical protein VNZ48_07070 [Xanthobacteraceae bacterium]|nr:hypothetical protein [Xanthobacteraceae bacterium]